jgi:hypothetical protein
MNEMSEQSEPAEDSEAFIESDKLMKLARLFKDKEVITKKNLTCNLVMYFLK